MDRLWQRLEIAPASACTLAEWRELFGAGFDRDLLESSGRFADTIAGAYPGAPRMRVYRHSVDQIAAVCDQNISPEVELEPESIELFRIPMRSLRSRLAHALGLQTSTSPATTLPGTVRIGDWKITPANPIPVWLVAHRDEGALRTLAREAVQRSESGCFVLTFTDTGWGDDIQEWARGRRGVMAPVSDIVELGEGLAWQAASVWAAYQDSLRHRLGLTEAGIRPPRIVRRRRGSRLACIERLWKELHDEATARVAMIQDARRRGLPADLPVLLKKDLAKRAKCSSVNLSHAFRDEKGKGMEALYKLLTDEKAMMLWWSTRRTISPALS